MIQNWIGKLLFNICGDLVEVIQYTQKDFPNTEIEINKWQGVGEKKNIKLKQSKIREWMMEYFGLNVDVKTAEIQLLQFKIPWNRLWKEPTKILIRDAYICVQTRGDFSQEMMLLRKQVSLKDFIEHQYKQLITNLTHSKKQSKFKRLLKNFFSEMIILEVENFHLRLEDEDNCVKNQRIALGSSFKKLILQPSYNNKNEQEIKRKLDFQVEDLSFYLKVESVALQVLQINNDHKEQQNVIIEPLTLKVMIHTNLTQSEDIPLRLVEILFADYVKLNIDDQQFSAILRLLKLREWYCQQGDYLQYRPKFTYRPKQRPMEWKQYWINIVKVFCESKKLRKFSEGKFNQKRQIRNSLINFILIDLFHQQYQYNDDRKYPYMDKQITYLDMLNLKQDIEDGQLLEEEIELVFYKVNKILNQPDSIKDFLIKMNIDQQQSPERKSTIWSFLWRQKSQQDEGTEFQSKYEKLCSQFSENEGRCLKRYQIRVANIQINLKIAQEKSITFMRIEFRDSFLQYELHQKFKNIQLKYKRIDGYDCLNPNKDFQTIFCYHSYIERSQRDQFINQELPQLEFSFEQHKELKKSIFKMKSLPHQMSLNDTVLARLQPFLNQLRKHDYFYDIVSISQGQVRKGEFINIIAKLCQTNSLILDINIGHITIRIPESAIKSNCPILQLTLDSYQLNIVNTGTQSINKFAISFHYIENRTQQVIQILEPLSIHSKAQQQQSQNEKFTDLTIENKISDICIIIPILNTDFLKNFVYNVLGTLDNLKKISNYLQREDLINLSRSSGSCNRRKRSRSFSQRDQSSKRGDDCSSQTSEIYYDAEEFINMPFMQNVTQSKQYQSPQEKREEMLKKWNKIRVNLNYLVNKIFKEADPNVGRFLESLQLKVIFELQKIHIKVAAQKKKNRFSYINIDGINAIVDKALKERSFGFNLYINSIVFSLYKLSQLKQLSKYSGPKQEDIMNHINEDMLNLLPFLLRIKELQINYFISINVINFEFQNMKSHNTNYVQLSLTKFGLSSRQPFRVMYKQQLSDKPFFLEINNSQVSQWDTTCECKFQLILNYFNEKLNEYEPFLEKTEVNISFLKNLTEFCFETKIKHLYFNFTPQLIFILYQLNQNSLQIKSLLVQKLNTSEDEIVEMKPVLTQKFVIEIENDEARLLVEQIEIQHTVHYKPKYKIQLEVKKPVEELPEQDEVQEKDYKHVEFEDCFKIYIQQHTFKKQPIQDDENIITEISQENNSDIDTMKRISSEIDVSEKQQQKQRFSYEKWKQEVIGDCLPCEFSAKYIFVNLTVQKLLFNLNGIEQYIKEKESKFVRCTDVMAFKITPSSRFFHYSSVIKTIEERTYFLKTKSKQDQLKNIYYLLTIINRNQNQIIIYQIEQLPKSPYLIKNKCSHLIVISQKDFPNCRQIIEPGKSEAYCWEDPFNRPQMQLEIHYEGEIKTFTIDIDGFNNQEIQIDKNFNSEIDTEYSLEIFNDGVQKVIVLTETESLKKKNKTYKLQCEQIGLSIIDDLEILYIDVTKVQYSQIQIKDIITYTLSAQNIEFDAQSFPIPKRLLYIIDNQIPVQKLLLRKQSASQQQQEQSVQVQEDQLKIKCKQKTISEILVHLKYIKVKIPNYKIVLDGNLFIQLFSFIKHTKLLLETFNNSPSKKIKINQSGLQQSFDKLNNSTISDKQLQIQPKKIHIDKVIIRPFSVKMKFKNLSVIEQELTTLHHYAGLVTFALSQFQQLNLEFQNYKYTDYSFAMSANYDYHIKQLFQVFSKSISDQLRGQLNTTNFLKNQGNLQKQFLQQLEHLQTELNQDDIFQGGMTFKFQLLQTYLVIGHSLYEALQSTLVTVLQGMFTYFETPKQEVQQKATFSNRLSKLFRKVSDFQFKSQINLELSYQMLVLRLKTKRFPKYISKNKQIGEYQEDLGKFQLYRLWKLGLDTKFEHFRLHFHTFLFLSNELFILIDTQYNQILLEFGLKKFQSMANTNSTCIIKYIKQTSKLEDDDEIGMKQLKIEKLMLNFTIPDSILKAINQLIKSNVEILNVKENQIFSIMMV